MRRQEEGGSKPGTSAIPLGTMAARARSQVIPKSQWPGRLSRSRQTFWRAGTLFERQGRSIQALWRLRANQRVAPRFGMNETVRSVALAQMRTQMTRHLAQALAR